MEYELTDNECEPTGPKEYHRHTLPPKDDRTWRDYARFPWVATRAYATRLNLVLGWRFIVYMGVSQCLLKGVAYSTISSAMLPIFKSVLQLDAKTMQLYLMIVIMPWSIKPLIGLLSDFTLVGGYHKRYWLVQAGVIGVLCGGFLFLAFHNRSAVGIALCFMGIQFQIALFDLMTESSYSAVMRDKPYTGSDVVTLVQGYQHVGTILSTLFVGIMADHNLFYPLFAIVVGMCIAPFVPTLLGWLPEEKWPHGEPQGNAGCMSKMVQTVAPPSASDWPMLMVIGFTGVAAPVTALVANVSDPMIALSIALLFTIAAIMGAYFVFPRLLFRIALYQVITSLSRPALGSAMDYFYTGDATCIADGPHFSYSYYVTVAVLAGAISSFCAVIVYQIFFSGLRYRWVLIITTLLSGAIGSSDLFIILRANIALGIPDKWAYFVGESVMEPMLNMLAYIPATALLSKVVPRGMESSAFAFLAGINNFAYMISEISGALIFDAAGVRTTVPCDFSSLWWLIIICHVTLPVVGGVSACFLIPNVYQTEALNEDGSTTLDEVEMDSFEMEHSALGES